MSAAPKKKPESEESAVGHPLLVTPVPHAYALIADPARPGRFFAVHLTDVLAKSVDFLEPSARSEAAAYGVMRMAAAMTRRHKEKRWTK